MSDGLAPIALSLACTARADSRSWRVRAFSLAAALRALLVWALACGAGAEISPAVISATKRGSARVAEVDFTVFFFAGSYLKDGAHRTHAWVVSLV